MKHYPYLIIGGGMTGDAAARAIRAADPSSAVGLISAEPHPPYARPPLSKGLWKGDPESGIWRGTDSGSPFHRPLERDRKSTRLNSSHLGISYAVFCLKKKK